MPNVLTTDIERSLVELQLFIIGLAVLLDGMGDGLCLGYSRKAKMDNVQVTGRTYLPVQNIYQFTNNTAFSILQATQIGRASCRERVSSPV